MKSYVAICVLLELCFHPLPTLQQGTTCTNGKVYSECGTACPSTCENYNTSIACTLQCVPGCYCPRGMVELGDYCVRPSDCSGPCATMDCYPHSYCMVSNITNRAICVPFCGSDNGGCRRDQICKIQEIECEGRCDPYRYLNCENSPLDPCTADVALPCPSNSRCLTVNTTGESFCLQSCFLDNGGCREDQVCTNTIRGGCDPTTQPGQCQTDARCQDLSDTRGRCPPGYEYQRCGSSCGGTCDLYVMSGPPIFCPEVCGIGCFCPSGFVEYRDRCVDPRECAILLNDPPPPNPLPISSDTVLLRLTVAGVARVNFNNTRQQALLMPVQRVLQSNSHPGVTVTVYAVYEDSQLQVVLELSGSRIRIVGEELAALIFTNRDTLPVEVTGVSVVEAPPAPEGLSGGANAGIVIGSVVGASLVILVIALVPCIVCCSAKKTKATPAEIAADQGEPPTKQPPSVAYSKLSNTLEVKTTPENEYTA